MAIRSSVTRSNILILTKAVWELPADIGGAFILVAFDRERDREDVTIDGCDELGDDGDGVACSGQAEFEAKDDREDALTREVSRRGYAGEERPFCLDRDPVR